MYLEEVLAVVTAEDVVVAAESELDTVVSTLEPMVELFMSISKIVFLKGIISEDLGTATTLTTEDSESSTLEIEFIFTDGIVIKPKS